MPDPVLISRAAVLGALESRAAALEASVGPERVQAHSRMLATEAEADQARFAARQLRIAADDIRAGLHDGDEPEETN